MNTLQIDIVTLFPDMFSPVLETSILGRAAKKGIVNYRLTNIRDFAYDKHQRADDYPYGGGNGMVMKPEPVFRAVEHVTEALHHQPRIVLTCPQGEPYQQAHAQQLANEQSLIFICGHYEGMDERIRKHLATDVFSIGDYVLTGGELPTLVMVDSIVRLQPGVLGNAESAETDSFSHDHLLGYPQYTRPARFRGWQVPSVLLSGHHDRITKWRQKQALYRTWRHRPDLLVDASLSDEEKQWLSEWKNNNDIDDEL